MSAIAAEEADAYTPTSERTAGSSTLSLPPSSIDVSGQGNRAGEGHTDAHEPRRRRRHRSHRSNSRNDSQTAAKAARALAASTSSSRARPRSHKHSLTTFTLTPIPPCTPRVVRSARGTHLPIRARATRAECAVEHDIHRQRSALRNDEGDLNNDAIRLLCRASDSDSSSNASSMLINSQDVRSHRQGSTYAELLRQQCRRSRLTASDAWLKGLRVAHGMVTHLTPDRAHRTRSSRPVVGKAARCSDPPSSTVAITACSPAAALPHHVPRNFTRCCRANTAAVDVAGHMPHVPQAKPRSARTRRRPRRVRSGARCYTPGVMNGRSTPTVRDSEIHTNRVHDSSRSIANTVDFDVIAHNDDDVSKTNSKARWRMLLMQRQLDDRTAEVRRLKQALQRAEVQARQRLLRSHSRQDCHEGYFSSQRQQRAAKSPGCGAAACVASAREEHIDERNTGVGGVRSTRAVEEDEAQTMAGAASERHQKSSKGIYSDTNNKGGTHASKKNSSSSATNPGDATIESRLRRRVCFLEMKLSRVLLDMNMLHDQTRTQRVHQLTMERDCMYSELQQLRQAKAESEWGSGTHTTPPRALYSAKRNRDTSWSYPMTPTSPTRAAAVHGAEYDTNDEDREDTEVCADNVLCDCHMSVDAAADGPVATHQLPSTRRYANSHISSDSSNNNAGARWITGGDSHLQNIAPDDEGSKQMVPAHAWLRQRHDASPALQHALHSLTKRNAQVKLLMQTCTRLHSRLGKEQNRVVRLRDERAGLRQQLSTLPCELLRQQSALEQARAQVIQSDRALQELRQLLDTLRSPDMVRQIMTERDEAAVRLQCTQSDHAALMQAIRTMHALVSQGAEDCVTWAQARLRVYEEACAAVMAESMDKLTAQRTSWQSREREAEGVTAAATQSSHVGEGELPYLRERATAPDATSVVSSMRSSAACGAKDSAAVAAATMPSLSQVTSRASTDAVETPASLAPPQEELATSRNASEDEEVMEKDVHVVLHEGSDHANAHGSLPDASSTAEGLAHAQARVLCDGYTSTRASLFAASGDAINCMATSFLMDADLATTRHAPLLPAVVWARSPSKEADNNAVAGSMEHGSVSDPALLAAARAEAMSTVVPDEAVCEQGGLHAHTDNKAKGLSTRRSIRSNGGSDEVRDGHGSNNGLSSLLQPERDDSSNGGPGVLDHATHTGSAGNGVCDSGVNDRADAARTDTTPAASSAKSSSAVTASGVAAQDAVDASTNAVDAVVVANPAEAEVRVSSASASASLLAVPSTQRSQQAPATLSSTATKLSAVSEDGVRLREEFSTTMTPLQLSAVDLPLLAKGEGQSNLVLDRTPADVVGDNTASERDSGASNRLGAGKEEDGAAGKSGSNVSAVHDISVADSAPVIRTQSQLRGSNEVREGVIPTRGHDDRRTTGKTNSNRNDTAAEGNKNEQSDSNHLGSDYTADQNISSRVPYEYSLLPTWASTDTHSVQSTGHDNDAASFAVVTQEDNVLATAPTTTPATEKSGGMSSAHPLEQQNCLSGVPPPPTAIVPSPPHSPNAMLSVPPPFAEAVASSNYVEDSVSLREEKPGQAAKELPSASFNVLSRLQESDTESSDSIEYGSESYESSCSSYADSDI